MSWPLFPSLDGLKHRGRAQAKFGENTALLNPKKAGGTEPQVMALATDTTFSILPYGEPTIQKRNLCLAHVDEE